MNSGAAVELPDLGQADAGVTLLSRWLVGDRDRVRPVAEALVGEWRDLSERFAPSAFLRLTCFAAATDPETDLEIDAETDAEVLCCAQWTSFEEHQRFASQHRSGLVARIDRAMPGITRPGLVRYRRDRRVRVARGPGADRVLLVEAQATSAASASAWTAATAEQIQPDRWPDSVSADLLISSERNRALLYVTSDAANLPVRVANTPGVHVHAPRVYLPLGTALGRADTTK